MSNTALRITRNGQTVTFDTTTDMLTQATPYPSKAGDSDRKMDDFLIDGMHVVAVDAALARQAVREYRAAQVAKDAENDSNWALGVEAEASAPVECIQHGGPLGGPSCGPVCDELTKQWNAAEAVPSEAEVMARVTGSVGATVVHQRRSLDGTLTETSRESFGDVEVSDDSPEPWEEPGTSPAGYVNSAVRPVPSHRPDLPAWSPAETTAAEALPPAPSQAPRVEKISDAAARWRARAEAAEATIARLEQLAARSYPVYSRGYGSAMEDVRAVLVGDDPSLAG